MQTKIEGLLLSKTEFQERHLICSILLRTGKTISVLFYGGQGGGKKKKPSHLELGTMLKVELSVSKSNADVYRAKEWKLIWRPENIRNNYRAFTLLCFIVEITAKIAGEENLHEPSYTDEHAGIFSVVSNAAFYLEKSVEANEFELYKELTIFLGKILGEQGVFPRLENCSLCEEALNPRLVSALSLEHGGFICSVCSPTSGDSVVSNELWQVLSSIGSLKYQDLESLKVQNKGISRQLLDYLLYQFQIEARTFKSLSMVFQL